MNRSVFPDDFTNVKLLLREALFIKKGNIIATHWKDKRDGICHFSHP